MRVAELAEWSLISWYSFPRYHRHHPLNLIPGILFLPPLSPPSSWNGGCACRGLGVVSIAPPCCSPSIPYQNTTAAAAPAYHTSILLLLQPQHTRVGVLPQASLLQAHWYSRTALQRRRQPPQHAVPAAAIVLGIVLGIVATAAPAACLDKCAGSGDRILGEVGSADATDWQSILFPSSPTESSPIGR